jgi:hypothetical protein
LDILGFGRREGHTSAASFDRWCGPSLCTNWNYIMAVITLATNVALREILAGLFPNVTLSSVGVSLLAAQIDGLEKECAPPAISLTSQRKHVLAIDRSGKQPNLKG